MHDQDYFDAEARRIFDGMPDVAATFDGITAWFEPIRRRYSEAMST